MSMRFSQLTIDAMYDIMDKRDYLVVKANDIIQSSRFSLTTQQQKILLTMISKIKPDDAPNTMYSVTVKEFCLLCNIECDNGKNYINIRNAISVIDKQEFRVKTPDRKKEIRLRWFNRLHYWESGTIEFSFNDDMFPFLFDLKNKFTQYHLINVLPMKSKYSIRLYEYLKSILYKDRYPTIPLEVLKVRMDAENYTNVKDFNRRVLAPAIEEINRVTLDLKVKAEIIRTDGSRVKNAVQFVMSGVYDEDELAQRIEANNEELQFSTNQRHCDIMKRVHNSEKEK